MLEKSTDKNNKTDFTTLIPEYQDQEIMEILKKRVYYQPEAADLAIKEAIKRGLIHSEQDLFAEEFRVKPLRYKLFPTIEKEDQKNKIRRSIARGLIITGALPTVWGSIRINDGVIPEGIILVTLGVLWIFLSSRIFRRTEKRIIRLLFILLTLSVIYVTKLLINLKSLVFMDVFVLLFLSGFIVYGLLFLLRIRK
ncbi:MAG TPA: hypothetical protein VKA38_07890 [Draconibacterium sp.]|nr:hypothetical protein [Draconibacterium sp.]